MLSGSEGKIQGQTGLSTLLARISDITWALSETETRDLLAAVTEYQDDILPYQLFDDASYQRNLIIRTDWVELLVLCWKPGQRSPLHDHAGSRCGVHVLQGSGTEIGFERSGIGLLVPNGSETLSVGDTSVSYDSEIHMLGNFSAERENLVTLHCYSPPLSGTNSYGQADTFMLDYDGVVEGSKKNKLAVIKD